MSAVAGLHFISPEVKSCLRIQPYYATDLPCVILSYKTSLCIIHHVHTSETGALRPLTALVFAMKQFDFYDPVIQYVKSK